jgi:hypothetical protein
MAASWQLFTFYLLFIHKSPWALSSWGLFFYIASTSLVYVRIAMKHD